MKHFGAAVLSVTILIVVWSIVAGLLTAVSLMLGGPETFTGKGLAGAAFVLGPVLGGLIAVYVTGRMAKELSSMQVFMSFAVAVIVFSAFFTAPWYLIQKGVGYGVSRALQAVVISAVLAITGGIGARTLLSRETQSPDRPTATS